MKKYILIALMTFALVSCRQAGTDSDVTFRRASGTGGVDTTPPTQPGSFAATPTSNTQINLTWVAATDETTAQAQLNYEICKALVSGGCSSFTASYAALTGGTNFSVTGLTASTTYYFSIRAKDSAGNTSVPTSEINATTQATPDVTPPAAVTTLAAGTVAAFSVQLNWTAVGDDNNTGTATSYAIRYLSAGACPITAGNFATGTLVSSPPTPQAVGSAETVTVSGLSDRTAYCFAMKVSDEVPNTSGISNVLNVTTADGTPPSAVTTLAAGMASGNSIVLNWTAVGDDGNVGTASSYELRYLSGASCPITAGNFATGTLVSGMPSPAVAGTTTETKTVGSLSPLTTYCFALKVSDEVPNTSGISNVVSKTTGAPTTASRVYGQNGSYTCGQYNSNVVCAFAGVSAGSLYAPAAVSTDGTGVYIVDQNNSRVLYYSGSSTSPTRVYGQGGSFTTQTSGLTANNLNQPLAVAADASGVYVVDYLNHRVLYFSGASTTATRVYGQGGSFTLGTANNGGISANSLQWPGGVAFDASGVYIADSGNARVLYYSGTSTTATRVYGQGGSFTTNTANNGGVSANSLGNPRGIALDASGVYVVDETNNRVLYYTGTSTTATRVYGQAGSFSAATANNGGLSADSLYQPWGIALDASGVYVADKVNNRILYYSGTSTTATRVYGQGGVFNGNAANNGGRSADSLSSPYGIWVDNTGLYVADYSNNRVLFY